ncbi:hypothetical protein NTE_02996 [Candidatus Nitrososphaera evergladensis SR1]|uniref:Uncharacterized protein n=1 Tax=Candidatus Nitrososphaera evergladensis SR1 TaxID=1459636 RepID=A0A075MTT4_9ARCH|nr:hypothetical protein [Candidatus Nitrososphaera evergladensis]AIF85031.1 hypothetical protein NTE_02996 [Candidatus Nitrososphaera evergladensis SR1]
MRLRRGHILLIAGGAIVALSFIASNYYASQFLKEIQEKNMHTIAPGAKFDLQGNITSGNGAYVVAFPNYSSAGSVRATVSISDPDGEPVLEKNLNLPFFSEPFAAQKQGNYTLTISNLGNTSLDASVIFGEEQVVGEVIGMPNVVSTAISSLLLIAGIIVLAAGGAIMLIDRHRDQKMKQFGDMSDLV